MALVNVIDQQKVWRKWGFIKSLIRKKIKANSKSDVRLRAYNRYSSWVFEEFMLPESSEELLNFCPESMDMHFEIIEADKIISKGLLKEYKEVNDIKKNEIPIQTPISSGDISEKSILAKESKNNHSNSNQPNLIIDVNKLFSTYVDTMMKLMEIKK